MFHGLYFVIVIPTCYDEISYQVCKLSLPGVSTIGFSASPKGSRIRPNWLTLPITPVATTPIIFLGTPKKL